MKKVGADSGRPGLPVKYMLRKCGSKQNEKEIRGKRGTQKKTSGKKQHNHFVDYDEDDSSER